MPYESWGSSTIRFPLIRGTFRYAVDGRIDIPLHVLGVKSLAAEFCDHEPNTTSPFLLRI